MYKMTSLENLTKEELIILAKYVHKKMPREQPESIVNLKKHAYDGSIASLEATKMFTYACSKMKKASWHA